MSPIEIKVKIDGKVISSMPDEGDVAYHASFVSPKIEGEGYDLHVGTETEDRLSGVVFKADLPHLYPIDFVNPLYDPEVVFEQVGVLSGDEPFSAHIMTAKGMAELEIKYVSPFPKPLLISDFLPTKQ